MDAVDPELVGVGVRKLGDTPGVESVHRLWLRWVGHDLLGRGGVRAGPTVEEAHVVIRAGFMAWAWACGDSRVGVVHALVGHAPTRIMGMVVLNGSQKKRVVTL